MTITLKPDTSQLQIESLQGMLSDEGLSGRVVPGEEETIVAIIGNENKHRDFLQSLDNLPFVRAVNLIQSPYKPISREAHPSLNTRDQYGGWLSTEIDVGPVKIGGNNPVQIAAGGCSIDADDPTLMDEMAHQLYEMGVRILRGGGSQTKIGSLFLERSWKTGS